MPENKNKKMKHMLRKVCKTSKTPTRREKKESRSREEGKEK